MKYNYNSFFTKSYILLLFITFISTSSIAQTVLNAGDIVITGYSADGGDKFSFLLLVDIDANTVINFTDQGWTGTTFFTASATEGVAVWTSGTALSCGSEIVISANDVNNSTSDIGTTTGGFDFATSGDQILAYQGSFASPNFITAFHNESGMFDSSSSNVNDSALPPGLIEGESAFAVNPEVDNTVYSGTIINDTAQNIRMAIYANSADPLQSNNYTSNNSVEQPLSTISWSFTSCLVNTDTAPPVVQSITTLGSPSSNAISITKRITFDESTNNVSIDDFTLTSTGSAIGTIASVSTSSGTTIDVTINSIGGEGSLRLDLLGTSNITDDSGNGNGTNGNVSAFTSGNTHTVDLVAPTISLGASSDIITNSGPITYTVTYSGANSITLANADLTLNTTGTATGDINVSGTGTSARTVTISNITGNGTLGFSIDANTASDTAGNNAAAAGPSATFNVDNTPPSIAIGAPSTIITNSGPITYSISYSNADNVTLTNADLTLNTTGTATGDINVSGTGTSARTVTISNITGNGTLGFSIDANTASDAVGNNAVAAGPSATFNVDNTPPSIAIGAPSAIITNSGPITYSISYSNADNVTLANADLTLNTTGTATGDINVSGTGTSARTVTISNITGNGTLGFSIDANTASDAVGNNAVAAGPSATFNVDNTPPSIAIGAPSAIITDSGPITYSISYSNADNVILTNADLTLNTTGTATGDINVSGTGTSARTVTISNITGNGTLGFSIDANTASDTVGNNAVAAGPSATFNVDNTPPSIAIGVPSATDTNNGPITYSVSYSNADSVTLTNADITLNTTGTATGDINVSGTGTSARTVTISNITGNGTLGFSIDANTASDTVGNNAIAAGPSATFNVDNTPPSIAIGVPSATDTNTGPITYSISYSNADNVTLTNADITLNTTGTATGIINVSGTGTSARTVTISNIIGNGTLGISIDANTASDTVGNNAVAAGPSTTFNVDNTPPSIAIGAPSATDTNTGPITYSISYSNADNVTLTNADITLNTTGTATGIVNVTGTGTSTRTVTISNITGNGTLGFSIDANTASDTAGNNAPAAGPSATFNVDNSSPSGYSVSIDQAVINASNTSAISYTFANAEIGATFNYTLSSNTGGTPVNGTGTITSIDQQIININTSGLSDGVVSLSVTLVDTNGNTGNTVMDTANKDTNLPSINIISTESSPTGANPIPVTITFNENVTGFEMTDIVVTNGTISNFTETTSNTVFDIEVTPVSNGEVTINIAANVAIDNASNGNSIATEFSILYDSTLSVGDFVTDQQFLVYPNPTNGILTINADPNLGIQHLNIFDIRGKLLDTQKLQGTLQINTIDITNIPSGVYFIRITSDKGNITRKIIKN